MESAENKSEHPDKEVEVGADQKSKPEEKKGVENKSQAKHDKASEGDSSDGKKVIWYNTKEEGFIHGILGLENDDFESFLEAKQEMSLSSILQGRINEKKAELEEKLNALPGKRSNLKRTSIEAEQERKWLHDENERIKLKEEELKRSHSLLDLEIKKINPYYTGFFAFFFILAGFTFMAGDFLYTKELSEVVLDEKSAAAIVFALAIALLTIVIKPAVDRVFEAPFRKGTNVVRSKVFLLVVSSLLLIVLAVLGYWRGYSIIQSSDTGGGTVTVERLLEARNAALDTPALMVVMTSLSALFALSGAICFSIGVPVLKDTRNRSKLIKKKKSQIDQINLLENQIVNNRKRISELTAIKEMADFEYTHLEDPVLLQKQIDLLDEKEISEVKAMFEFKVKEKLGYYREAIAKGQKVQLSGNLVMSAYQLYRILGLPVRPASGRNYGGGRTPKRAEEANGDREYLHERLRDILRHEFKTKSK